MAASPDNPSFKKLPDDALVGAAKAGAVDAFGELSNRYYLALRLFITRICADPADAEDFTQDAFIAAWQKLGKLKDNSAFKAWLFTSAVRLVKDRQKSRNRAKQRDHEWHIHSDTQTAVTDSIIAKLDVEAALAKLPETERLVASLIYGAGFSQSEASRVSGIPLGSIKTYSLRVRKILIHHLDARED